jgi:hypothetical protein
MRRGAGPLLCVLVGALVAGAGPAAAGPEVHVERDVVDVSPPAGVAVDEVAIDNRYGDVVVIGHDEPQVAIEAIKRAPDADTLGRLKVQLVPDPSGAVMVTALIKSTGEARPLAAGAVRIDLIVRVPRKAHVAARLWKGRAEARNLDRGVALSVDHGEIAVQAVSGEVAGETSFGGQRYADVFGALEARAIEGDLALERVRGARLTATVWKGNIEGRRIEVRELEIHLGSGDVRLALEALRGGRYTIAAARGDVVVTIGGKAATRVVARGAGKIELPRRLRNQRTGKAGELIGHLGSGASPAVLDLSSKTGNVTLAEF